jgi:hypothetical protein
VSVEAARAARFAILERRRRRLAWGITPPPLVNTAVIPAAIKALPCWVCWSFVGHGSRASIVHLIPRSHGGRASGDDPRTWRTFATAISDYNEGLCDGLAFAAGGTSLGPAEIDALTAAGVVAWGLPTFAGAGTTAPSQAHAHAHTRVSEQTLAHSQPSPAIPPPEAPGLPTTPVPAPALAPVSEPLDDAPALGTAPKGSPPVLRPRGGQGRPLPPASVAPPKTGGWPPLRRALAQARIAALLADGPLPRIVMNARCTTLGITAKTRRNAETRLRTVRWKESTPDGPWWVALPDWRG